MHNSVMNMTWTMDYAQWLVFVYAVNNNIVKLVKGLRSRNKKENMQGAHYVLLLLMKPIGGICRSSAYSARTPLQTH